VPFGGVLYEQDVVFGGSVILADALGIDGRVKNASVLADKSLAQGIGVRAGAGNRVIEQARIVLDIVGVGQIDPGQLHHFLTGVTHEVAKGVVDLDPAFVGDRVHCNPDQGIVEQVIKPLIGVPDVPFCFIIASFRHIRHEHHT